MTKAHSTAPRAVREISFTFKNVAGVQNLDNGEVMLTLLGDEIDTSEMHQAIDRMDVPKSVKRDLHDTLEEGLAMEFLKANLVN